MNKVLVAVTAIVMIITFTEVFSMQYTIKQGDTAWRISRDNQVPLDELKKLNPTIKDINVLKVGQVINLPGLDLERLASAFIFVESRGNDLAVGDGGKAIGCLQMWTIMVDEANRLYHRKYHISNKWSYDDRKSRTKSVELFKFMVSYKGCKTVEDAVRIWNPTAPESIRKKYVNAYNERR